MLQAKRNITTRSRWAAFHLFVLAVFFWFVAGYNYLLFHFLVEMISVVISVGIFMVCWNARRFLDNNYFLFIGIAFLTIGGIDLLHALSYEGMGVFRYENMTDIATQLWIAGRYVTALSFILAICLNEKKLNPRVIFAGYSLTSFAVIVAIFYWRVFPVMFIEGVGLTKFKIYSEYAISLILLASLYFFYKKREQFDPHVHNVLFVVVILIIVSELLFTLYIGVYDWLNWTGHIFKISANYLSYIAIVEFALMKPYRMLFKNLKDSEVKYRRLTETVKDCFFALSPELRIIYWNKACEDLSGVRAGEAVGKRIGDIPFIFSDIELIKRYNQVLVLQQPDSLIEEAETEKGKQYFEIFLYPGPLETSVFTKNVTERVNMEKAKDEFLSLASHQLKTPLTSIALSSELMLRGIAGPINGDQEFYVKEMLQSSKRMDQLVVRLLDISRIEMNKLKINLNYIDINGLITNVAKDFQPRIDEKDLDFSLKLDENVGLAKLDANIFEMIADNLISNAIRYTEKGGKISVSSSREKSQIKIEVADSGCGIPDDQKNRIFDKSFRAENAAKIDPDGLGLGLYMVKLLADKMNIKIDFESESGKGSIFRIFIPVNL